MKNPYSHILTPYEADYTPLGSLIARQLDNGILRLHRKVWRNHKGKITRREFEKLCNETAQFRGRFPLAHKGKIWNP